MVRFSDMSRGQFLGVVVSAVVFVVGAVVVVREVGSLAGKVAKDVTRKPATSGEVTTVNNANFSYLVPAQGGDWSFDQKSAVFDNAKGLVQYRVTLVAGNVGVIITQQRMPAALAPVGSAGWNNFIGQQKAVAHQAVGGGTVYYLAALMNGAQVASGSDTIIYGDGNVLMFGRAPRILDAAAWTKLLQAMSPVAAQ